MAEYEISNPSTNTLSLRSGPSVIFDRIGTLASGQEGKGDFIYTYQSQLVTDGQTRVSVGDQWVHATEPIPFMGKGSFNYIAAERIRVLPDNALVPDPYRR